MKKSLTATLAASALVLSFGLASAQAEETVSGPENGNLWFVELSGNPTADGNSLNAVRAEKAAFKAAAKAAGISFKELRSFDVLFNGYSVEVDAANRNKLAMVSGVKALWPVEVIQAPNPEVSSGGSAPDLATAIAMTGADIAQNTLGYTGAGVKVAVMDTGIDVNHPDFGGNGVAELDSSFFYSHPRIRYGYDFVGNAFNADSTSPTYNPVPTPDDNPDDCGGHGTHVAGIVGANGAVKGVAPGVTFGAYRVFGCNGSTFADIMIAAMERALADGMDVLNMSIGSSFQWPQYPTAAASDRLVNKGMVVVASIGNSGANGLYSTGAPGVGKKVIGTASFDNTHVFLPYATVNAQNIGYVTMTFSPPAPTSGSGEVVDVGLACGSLPAGSAAGRIALAARGTCSFAIKATNAINAGAEAVLISNNAAGVFNGTLGGPLPDPRPVVGISQADGNFIRAQAAPVILNWTALQASFPSPTGGLISSFSSYGLSPDLSLKPDIGAPGGNIYSSYPLEAGGYATMGGTSMASPHVAGAAALVLEAKPKTNSQVMRTILQNSADPKNWSGNPGLGFLDHVHRQGAGMVDIDDAILATTKVTPGKIAAGEGEAGPYAQMLRIENNGPSGVTYDLSYVNALSTGGVITPSFWLSNAGVSFSASSVYVPAGGSAGVMATITPATSPTFGQYGGYIMLTPQGGGQVYRVPYAGFVGDYQSIQVLTPTGNGFPWLAKTTNGSSFSNNAAGVPYTMVGLDIPFFAVHFDHQSRRVRFEVFNAVSGKAWHRISDYQYFGRNSTATGFFAFAWDGTTYAGRKVYTVPNGQYVVKLLVLKALGDESNPAHWETWTSPVITIARP